MTTRWSPTLTVAAVALLCLSATVPASAAEPGAFARHSGPRPEFSAETRADFNGDGFADAAIGIPGETVAGVKGVGAVLVLYGSATGLSAAGSQLLTPHVDAGPAGETSPYAGTAFGSAIDSSDFDGDMYSDLMIGAPNHPAPFGAPSRKRPGAVCFVPGSATGLDEGTGCLYAYQVHDEANLRFGAAVAMADLVDATGASVPDGQTDFAIGAPGYENGRGAVFVLLPPPISTVQAIGSRPAGDLMFPHRTFEGKQPDEHYGSVLSAGVIGRGLADDLVVGVPLRDVTVNGKRKVDAGAVDIIYDAKLADSARVTLKQGSGVGDRPEAGDHFGAAVAVGDVTDDGWDDVIVGVPGEDLDGKTNTGMVHVLRTLQLGQLGAGFKTFNMGSAGIPGNRGTGDLFGSALAIGDLGNPDGLSGFDLVVGAPGRTVNGRAGAGVVVALASNGGDIGNTAQLITQDTPGVGDTAEQGDHFGSSLYVGEYRAPVSALVIGIPREDVGAAVNAGAIQVLYAGSTTLLKTAGSRFITQQTQGVPGQSGNGDRMGFFVR